jgi:hypothetical protein
MSCDEQNRFEILLRSLGARDASINCLRDQSVKEVLHLLFIEEDDITSWKPDSFLSAIECKIICHLRTYVHTCKRNNDNRLPSNWHVGLTLDTLSSPLNLMGPTPTRAGSPNSLIVYVRMLGLGNARNLPDYCQFKKFRTDIFRDLVGGYLIHAVQNDVFIGDGRVDLILKSPTITYSQVRDENPKWHQLAVLNNSCLGVFITKSLYVMLKYSEQEKRSKQAQCADQENTLVSKEKVLKRLMSTPRGIPQPVVGKQDFSDFPKDLYNFLLDHYEAKDLHVDVSAIPVLAAQTRAIRDLLQLTHSRIDQKHYLFVFATNSIGTRNETALPPRSRSY